MAFYGSKKTLINTTKFRLTSPNFSSSFDFTPCLSYNVNNYVKMNPGPFKISCTLKPYEPFIQIQPHFDNLYGSSYLDGRGLICGGDFSLPIMTSAWTDYVNNNKNYLNAFDREIQYDKTKRDINSVRDAMNVSANLSKGVSGIASAVNSGVNMGLNIAEANAAIDYKTDQFNYSLENIQARPASLAKVGPFNINNKYIPFLEIYDCTDTEKVAFANKIKYNGMKIMRIGNISDFINKWNYYAGNVSVNRPYIKGKLINLEDSTYFEDFHITNDIANELNNGVYVELK